MGMTIPTASNFAVRFDIFACDRAAARVGLPVAWAMLIPWFALGRPDVRASGRPPSCKNIAIIKLWGTQAVMAKKIVKRPRGRPVTTGIRPFVGARLAPELLEEIDRFAKRAKISRGEAIRILLARALAENKLN